VRDSANRLYRTALECVRQRERYSRLVEAGAHEFEQQAALRVACLCDDILLDSVRAYEKAVANEPSKSDDDWWHKANSLWHACREYQRRHHNCEESARQLTSRKPGKFGELTLAFDLEASALLATRLAMAAYRKVSPGAELDDRPQSFVA